MKALYSLVLASGTKEALFAALWLALDEEPGKLEDATFADVVKTAERFGVSLTESQARKRVKELEKLDVLEVVPKRERGRFDLLVFQPAPAKVANEPKPEPATPLFDAAFGRGVESFATASVSAAVSKTKTKTEAAAKSIAKPTASVAADHFRDAAKMIQTPEFATCAAPETSPSEAERADALLARSPFADALRRAVWPKEYENIAWNVRIYRCPPEGFSDDEHDAMDSRVCELYAESRRIADEFDDRLQRGEYADKGGSERCDAEREAALRAFAATRNPAIAPTFAASTLSVAASLEEINNNKYIKNKTINKPAKIFKDETQAEPEARSVADVRLLVDFESPKVAAFRRLVARSVWERTVHPDLIDRIVALAVLRVGGTDAKAVESMIRDAKDAVALWNRTDGRRGQPQIWRALTPEVKRVFENAGWTWSPTRFATEPRPEPRRVAETVDA